MCRCRQKRLIGYPSSVEDRMYEEARQLLKRLTMQDMAWLVSRASQQPPMKIRRDDLRRAIRDYEAMTM
jgi:hypothetical protein